MLRRSFLMCCGITPLFGAGRVEVPSAQGSRAYALTASTDGDAYLVWVESVDGRHALRLSRLEGETWTPATTVATGSDDWFINSVDHPAVAAGPGGRLMVSYPFRPPAARGEKWGLATRMLFSSDRGQTWKHLFDMGHDNTADYTGFIGFWAGRESFRAAYLAPDLKGEAQRGAPHVKTLRFAEFSLNGERLTDELVDADVCTCCPLATADTVNGPIVAYRDHFKTEIRDISIVRRVDGKWTEPRPVHNDGWEIAGCPANGAAIQADGTRVATAWFTAANERPRVRLALSNDAGATFGEPIEMDSGSPAGWVGVALLDEGRTAVTWLEKRGNQPGVGDVTLRIVDRDGQPGRPRPIAETYSGRTTGIPQIVRSGDRLVVAWRSDDNMRTAVLSAGEFTSS